MDRDGRGCEHQGKRETPIFRVFSYSEADPFDLMKVPEIRVPDFGPPLAGRRLGWAAVSIPE